MNVSKEFVERILCRLTHHDLITIERSLKSYHIRLMSSYYRTASLLDSCDSNKVRLGFMRDLCYTFDKMCDVRTVLLLFKDIRLEDFKNKSYEISSHC